MNELESIIGRLENQGIPVDKTLLAHRIEGLMCQYPTQLEFVACDGNTIFVKVFDMLQQVAMASGEVIATHPATQVTASLDVQPASPEITEVDPALDQVELQEDDPTKAALARRTALRNALDKAEKEAERLSDPANVRLPQFEEKGYSWSLTL